MKFFNALLLLLLSILIEGRLLVLHESRTMPDGILGITDAEVYGLLLMGFICLPLHI